MADRYKGMDQSQLRAMRLFEIAKERRAEAAKFGLIVSPLRVRLAEHIDLSKANKNCKRCDGTGVAGYEVTDQERIPRICRCVSKGGGVQRDRLDELLDKAERAVLEKIPPVN